MADGEARPRATFKTMVEATPKRSIYRAAEPA